jgi:hypothetical protein
LAAIHRAAQVRQNSYATGAQEFAIQPYPAGNDVQTQPLTFGNISGEVIAAFAGCVECAVAFVASAADFDSKGRKALRAAHSLQTGPPTYTSPHSYPEHAYAASRGPAP